MGRLLIKNVTLLRGEFFEIFKGHIVVEDGVIESIRTLWELDEDEHTHTIDGTELVVIPGLVNAHTYILDATAKEEWIGHTIPETFGEGGIKHTVLNGLDTSALAASANQALTLMLRTGTTSTCAFVEKGVEGVKAVKQAVSTSTQGQAHCTILATPTSNEPDKAELEELARGADGFAPSSLSSLNDEVLEGMKAESEGKVRAVHVAECNESKSVSRAIDQFGAQFLVHGNYLNEAQMKKMADAKCGLVCCMRSSSSFGLKSPDLVAFDKLGGSFAFGTDNFMSNTPDMFRELEFVTRRLLAQNRGKLPFEPERILRAATVDAAKMIGREKVGLIEEGYVADLVFLRLTDDLKPFRGAMSVILRAGAQHIAQVMQAGEMVWPKTEGGESKVWHLKERKGRSKSQMKRASGFGFFGRSSQ